MTKQRMHCQCCGRAILANAGVIAHHGYERPEIGWQTSSCMGARHLPFEVSRDQLGILIAALERMLADKTAYLASAEAETVPIPFTYRVRHIDKRDVTIDVTRATFDALKAEHALHFRTYSIHKFDDLKKRHVYAVSNALTNLHDRLTADRARFNAWKPTHQRAGNEWQPCSTQ